MNIRLLRHLALAALFCLCLPLSVRAQTSAPRAILYQGRISIDGKPLSGTGQFKFAVVGDRDSLLLTTGPLNVTVSNGFYSVRLGDDAEQAAGLNKSLIRQTTAPKLRIWFNDRDSGWQQIGDDVPLLQTPAATPSTDGTQTEILTELRQIRAMLANQQQARPAPVPAESQIVTVPVGDAPSLGSSNAPLALVEFTDFQCQFCAKFENETFPQLTANYIDTGKVRFFSRSLTMSFHPLAETAAKAAICGGWQGRFWELREKFFAANSNFMPDTLARIAQEAGVDLNASRTNAQAEAVFQSDAQAARTAGLRATPSFVLGRLVDGKVTGLRIVGAQPYSLFENEIQKLLASQK